jgi:hypothetical protein
VPRKLVEPLELENAVVDSQPLAYEAAEDLLPEVAQVLSRGFDNVSPQVAEMAKDLDLQSKDPRVMLVLIPAIAGVVQQLGGGQLKRLAPRILATTTVTITGDDGSKNRYDMCKKEDRALCFDERPDIYFQVLWHAGKVTFGRFFPGGRKAASLTPPAETKSAA